MLALSGLTQDAPQQKQGGIIVSLLLNFFGGRSAV
jgi:hypothetical protein